MRNKLWILAFLIPLAVWSLVSYVPFIWHPMVQVTEPGGVGYFVPGMLVERTLFEEEKANAAQASLELPAGHRANPVYLPAPHKVAGALYTAFTTPPRRSNEPWLHQSLAHSIRIIFWGFILSSIFGLPIGILCGSYPFVSRITEPFVDFIRYMPAPAFGALAVAVLGIHDGPKIAIIFIGTFFQQVLVVANTTRQVNVSLLEAAQTLGAKGTQLLTRVIIPASSAELFRNQRILLGWAWTYLIVAEIIGTSSGITWFINQQAKYRNYEFVFAGIIIIGLIGLTTDLILAWLGRKLFPWENAHQRSMLFEFIAGMFGPRDQTLFRR